jgi:prolyl-tRNA synthetase
MYDVKFQTASNQLDYCYYMSAGITTRLLGCLIVVHGDDQGLVLPFPIAPVQISIMTILANKDPQVLVYAKQIKKMFRSYAVEINDQDQSLGVKISKQTKMGTPILLLIGPNDVKSQTVTLMRRDLLVKQTVDFKQLKSTVSKTIKDYQKQL